MIELYSWPTPNGHKIHIMLEECELAYRIHAIDIGKGEQFAPHFLAISPNNKIPALYDPNGPEDKPISLFESGAILLYLAQKTGRFLGASDFMRYKTIEWLFFQTSSLGPMLGQVHHFCHYAPERIEYAIKRYTQEAKRLYQVLNHRLGQCTYLAGEEYTIADIASFPWVRSAAKQQIDLNNYPHVKRWFETIEKRSAVQKGVAVLEEKRRPLIDDEAKKNLFGIKQ